MSEEILELIDHFSVRLVFQEFLEVANEDGLNEIDYALDERPLEKQMNELRKQIKIVVKEILQEG
ncbi:MAG: hypothetical protein GPJ51_08375 [Candidatus Heimdallarchaeota archaeon]|nr:hypothetical protein [Candidatus Heimdallarchaeota archaeon]